MRAEVRDVPGGTTDLLLVPGDNLELGDRQLASGLGEDLTSLEIDLLRFAAAVYAVDLAVPRGARENSVRHIELSVPVVNTHAFNGISAALTRAMHLLSRDTWRLEFRAMPGTPEGHTTWPDPAGTTLLFSGGLDSLAAAVDLLGAGEATVLVSHRTGNSRTTGSQDALLEYLRGAFAGVRNIAVRVRPQNGATPFPNDTHRENSQRTRSLLFVALASLVARRTGHRRVVMMAENGPLAIHVAFSAARAGPFSTHTAHPEYLAVIGPAMSQLLGVDIEISNPYLYCTKAEVVAGLVRDHPAAIPHTISCWKASRQAENHCGYCVPCIVRRFALERHGYTADVYHRNLLAEDLDRLTSGDDGLRNLHDVLDFAAAWAAPMPVGTIAHSFPELRNRSIDQGRAAELYRRFAVELLDTARSYPALAARLGP